MTQVVAAKASCAHIMVMDSEGTSAFCVFCNHKEVLKKWEIQTIDQVQRAGAIVVRMSAQDRKDRESALASLSKTRKRRKRKRAGKALVIAPDEIPEGYLTPAMASDAIDGKWNARKLRRYARDGKIERRQHGSRILLKMSDVHRVAGTAATP